VAVIPSLFSTKYKQRVNVLPSTAPYTSAAGSTNRNTHLSLAAEPYPSLATSGQGHQGRQSQGQYEKRSLLRLAAASNTLPSMSARSLSSITCHQRQVTSDNLSLSSASSSTEQFRHKLALQLQANSDSTVVVKALTDSSSLTTPPTASSAPPPTTLTIDREPRLAAPVIDRLSLTVPVIDQPSLLAPPSSERLSVASSSVLHFDEHNSAAHTSDNRFPGHDIAAPKHKYKITLHYPEAQASCTVHDVEKSSPCVVQQQQPQSQQHQVTGEGSAKLATKKSSLVNHHNVMNSADDSRLLTTDLHIHGDNIASLNNSTTTATALTTTASGKKLKSVRFAETVLDINRESRSLSQPGASLHHHQLELQVQQPQRRWSSPVMTSWARRGVTAGGAPGGTSGVGGGQQLVPTVPSTRTQMPAVAERYVVRASFSPPHLHNHENGNGADIICLLHNRYSHLPVSGGPQHHRLYVSSSSGTKLERQDALAAANSALQSTSQGISNSRRWHQRDIGRELRADVIFNFGRVRLKRPDDSTVSATSGTST
jgi:hypothetical protein